MEPTVIELPATTGVLAAMRYLADKKPEVYRIKVSGQGVFLREVDLPGYYSIIWGKRWYAPFWARFATYSEARAHALGYPGMDGEGI